jgi:prefoldin subunit 5
LYQNEIDSLEEEREKAIKEVNELKSRIEMLESELSRLKTAE